MLLLTDDDLDDLGQRALLAATLPRLGVGNDEVLLPFLEYLLRGAVALLVDLTRQRSRQTVRRQDDCHSTHKHNNHNAHIYDRNRLI